MLMVPADFRTLTPPLPHQPEGPPGDGSEEVGQKILLKQGDLPLAVLEVESKCAGAGPGPGGGGDA